MLADDAKLTSCWPNDLIQQGGRWCDTSHYHDKRQKFPIPTVKGNGTGRATLRPSLPTDWPSNTQLGGSATHVTFPAAGNISV